MRVDPEVVAQRLDLHRHIQCLGHRRLLQVRQRHPEPGHDHRAEREVADLALEADRGVVDRADVGVLVVQRAELAALYARVMDAAKGKRVAFRTLDIGSDKVLPYMKPQDEPNPAMGWRAIRVGLDKPGVLRMQLQALIRASKGRPLTIMFPFISEHEEFLQSRAMFLHELEREKALGHVVPERVEVGAMLETPSLAYAPRAFFELTDFVSIGGNDLKQFFFAADRENERVRRRYDTLNVSFLRFLDQIVARCAETGTTLSFCGEDAGRPVEALAFAAIGITTLSMRPASIGPVKALLRRQDLTQVRAVIDQAMQDGADSVRPHLMQWLADQGEV